MPSSNAEAEARRGWWWGPTAVASLCLLADQLSKQWAWTRLRGQPPLVLRPQALELDYAFNTGSAFSLFADSPMARPVLIALSLVTAAAMVALIRRLQLQHAAGTRGALVGALGLGLVLGGALGNLVDRLVRVDDVPVLIAKELPWWIVRDHPLRLAEAILHGRPHVAVPHRGVVDFIVVYLSPTLKWPSFNVADLGIVAGLAVFALSLALRRRQQN